MFKNLILTISIIRNFLDIVKEFITTIIQNSMFYLFKQNREPELF